MEEGATTAAATCQGRPNHCRGGNSRGNLSGGTLFTSWCQQWWMKAVGGGGGSGGGQRPATDDSFDGSEQ
jgi:hypothetical protein